MCRWSAVHWIATLVAGAVLAAGCGRTSLVDLTRASVDAASVDGEVIDTAVVDARVEDDGGLDAGIPEIGVADALPPDLAFLDATAPDLSFPDATAPDLSFLDATAPDLSFPDATAPDLSFPDAMPSLPDAGVLDASIDGGTSDSGVPSPACFRFGTLPVTCPDAFGRIGNWLVLGTFPSGGCGAPLGLAPITAAVRPRAGDMVGGRVWTRYTSAQVAQSWTTRCQPQQACFSGVVSADLNCHYSGGARTTGAPDRVRGFAFTYLHVARTQTVRMRVGADDGVLVWLDGQLRIDEADNCQCWADDQFEATLTLTRGVHALLVQVGDGGGHWGFSLRFTTPRGIPLRTDLHAQLFP